MIRQSRARRRARCEPGRHGGARRARRPARAARRHGRRRGRRRCDAPGGARSPGRDAAAPAAGGRRPRAPSRSRRRARRPSTVSRAAAPGSAGGSAWRAHAWSPPRCPPKWRRDQSVRGGWPGAPWRDHMNECSDVQSELRPAASRTLGGYSGGMGGVADHHAEGLNRTAISATLHCLTGCAIGEVLGLVISTWWGWSNAGNVALSVSLAFVFGYSLTLIPLLRAGLSVRQSLPLAFASDTLSIATMELLDTLTILVVPGAMDAGLGDPLFWGSLAAAPFIAFWAAFPVNRALIARGKGHAVVHAYHH